MTEPGQYEPRMEMETPTLTRASVLLARGDRSSLTEALDILATSHSFLGPLSRTSVTIKYPRASGLWPSMGSGESRGGGPPREGGPPGEAGGYARVLVDLGVDVTPLLRQLFAEAARLGVPGTGPRGCLVRDARTERPTATEPGLPRRRRPAQSARLDA